MIEIILGAIAAIVFHFALKELKDNDDLTFSICILMLAVCSTIALSILVMAVNELIKRLL